ncbi:uncharacterized protein BX663DRAFT_229044 [Cokeromyces recurvatus]|uniref:uncharacterized protein n=1 Tax=Cokeromyces recurvatus TaxID=90255 RepID=UPI002220572F|nr:uncharacterized protein BX663DRAFT_229044 [Cokeromyces recurvatus]KAI7898934.1 hypothetical protein BX663DRAFT_229044 [Cokeromyces recurvatus]
MNILEHRIASFHNSITKWPYTNKKYHKTETFAKAGFYFLTRPKLPDTTRCFLCDIELSHWKQGQSPYIRHATESPSCPWVILNFPDDPTKRSTIKLQPQHPKMRAARLATFNSHNFWPPVKRDVAGRRKFLASTKLADAGFILSPTSDNKSRVKCPYCQCCINTPINDIDALKSHSQFNSACIFFDQSNNVGSKSYSSPPDMFVNG